MIKKFLSLSIIAVLALSACEKETRSLVELEDETIQNYLKSNNLNGFIKDTSGFYYKIISAGTGEMVGYPDYVGVSQTTTSINKSVSYEFSKYSPQYTYVGYINPVSWRESVLKIRKGGEVRVITPSFLAYGKNGSGTSIPGNAILDTKLRLVNDVDRSAYEDDLINSYLSDNELSATRSTDSIYYKIITPGTGTPVASSKASLKVAYTGKLLTGAIFDQVSTRSPVSINIANAIEGWRKILPLIREGGKINLYVPSRYAYGPNPNNGIPANAILQFEIELIEVTN